VGSITAVLSYTHTPAPEVARRGLDAAPHRGSTIRTSSLARFVVGASTSDEWDDATLSEGNGLVVAVQGRIDNLPELTAHLSRAGVDPGPSPADVVRALFLREGERTPERLRGVYAIVLSDGLRLWCFRDHLGFATLFYRAEREGIYVATEAKQVVAAAGIPWRPDPDVAHIILHRDYDDDTPAAIRGVSRLAKMTILSAEPGRVRRRRYWRPEQLLETARYSPGELQERFDELMTQAVRRTLTGKGDVVSLSGGLDSPAIVAYGAPEHLRLTGEPLAAITTSYPHLPAVDERPFVEDLSRVLGLKLHVVERRAAFLEGIQEWVRILDGPVPKIATGDAREGYTQAADLGYRTMITGEVAEYLTDQRSGLIPYLVARGRFGAARRQIRGARAKGMGRGRLAKQAILAFIPLAAERSYRRLHPRDDPTIPDWLHTPTLDQLDTYAPAVTPARDRWATYQLGGFIGPGLSMESDAIVQELCGIRVRRPWADVDLWEFFLGLRAETKFPDSRRKALARDLLRDRVPDLILDRKGKVVFDDSIMERIDYVALRRWLVDPPVRVGGVDYGLLEKHLADEDFGLWDHIWAKDLASVHAFLALG
jgi:asparagine synthetase B (glutamine-hydrolysing)